MTTAGWAQLIALVALIGVTAPLLGRYMANVFEGGPSRLDRVLVLTDGILVERGAAHD